MTVVMYRSQQRGRRGQRIVTTERQEVRSCLLNVVHSFFLVWLENLMVFLTLSLLLKSKVSLRWPVSVLYFFYVHIEILALPVS